MEKNNTLMQGYICRYEIGKYDNSIQQITLDINLQDEKSCLYLLRLDILEPDVPDEALAFRDRFSKDLTALGEALIHCVYVEVISNGSDGVTIKSVDLPDHKIEFKTINWSFR